MGLIRHSYFIKEYESPQTLQNDINILIDNFIMPRRKDQTDESQEDDDDDSMEGEKIQIRKPKIERIDKFKNLKKIIINVSMTQYPVVSQVAEDLNWKIQTSNDAGDWDVYWTDFSIDPDVLIKMHLFQKINHFPGIHVIARKNLLGHNLTNMGKRFPDEYNFFPMTWMLPQQYADFRQYYQNKQKGKTRTYIVKPEADCQGRGIFLTRKIQDMQTGKHYVVQRYMARPYLLDGLKFDMRIYVLMCGTDPLKLYLYNEGLARLATQPYQQPMNANLDRLCMHLTNYAINKFNPNFIFNNNVNNMGIGHKRALSCVFKQLAQKGLDVDKLKQKIKDIIIKTIISGLPLMSHQYKFSQPEDYSGNMCFHILGMDVMMNNKGEPFVIQVNHTPSFTTDTPLDHKIKFSLIKDALVLMNVNVKQKNQLYNRCKDYNSQRLLTGKRHIYQGQDRQAKIKQAQLEREKYQSKHLGGFQKIFPLDDPDKNQKYQQMIGAAMKMYMEENQAVKARYEEKQMKKLMRSELRAKRQPKQAKVAQVEEQQCMAQNQSTVSQQYVQQQMNQAAPRDENLTLSQPIPVIENQICQDLKNNISKAAEASASDMRRVNQIRKPGIRDNSYTAERKQKSEKVIHEGKFFNRDKLRASSKRSTPTQLKRTDGSSECNPKQAPGNSSGGIIDLIQGVENNRRKRTERIIQNKFILKSEPKPMKLLESIEKQIKNNIDRKFQNSNNNGGFVMPKIYSLNVDPERLEKDKQQFNFLSLGRKVQSTLYQNNNA